MAKARVYRSGEACPQCGEILEAIDGQYIQTAGFDGVTEPEFGTLWECVHCPTCNFQFSDEP
jgi:ssDNA-binding Zn-finger/Zn-ribbon topoisomerase 1